MTGHIKFGINPLPALKPLVWIGGAKEDLSAFPDAVKMDIGHALFVAQQGGKAPAAKPLKGFGGAGVLEARGARDMARREKPAVTTGSAFHALGLPDADELVLRSALIRKAAEAVRASGLTQSAVGRLVGMEQPRISALLAEKISLFSTDRLVAVLVALGHDIVVKIRRSKSGQGRMRVAA